MVPFLFFLLFMLVALSGMRINKGFAFQENYLSVQDTTAFKGIFVLIILMSHSRRYLDLSGLGQFYSAIPRFLGQMMVIPFMLYSGFGVMESITKKGTTYVRRIPKKRVLTTWMHFAVIDIIYLIAYTLMGKAISPLAAVRSFFGLEDSIDDRFWYVFTIIVMYLLTWAFFSLFRRNSRLAVFFMTGCSAVLVLSLRYFNLKSPTWYDTLIFYPGGMLLSLYKKPITELGQKLYLWIPAFGLCVIGLYFFHNVYVPNNFLLVEVYYAVFTAAIVLFSMRIKVTGKILTWYGKHIFTFYILGYLPMQVLQYWGVTNPWIFLPCTFAATTLLSWGMEKALHQLDNVLFSGKRISHGTA